MREPVWLAGDQGGSRGRGAEEAPEGLELAAFQGQAGSVSISQGVVS